MGANVTDKPQCVERLGVVRVNLFELLDAIIQREESAARFGAGYLEIIKYPLNTRTKPARAGAPSRTRTAQMML